MRIAILNKSDARGGAAVVSRRLMHALREEGADARMLVVEKLTADRHVERAAPRWRAKLPFLAERLQIFAGNGMNRSTLFKTDTASAGLPLWKHPMVREADALILNWVNQGMLSLEGVERLVATGKPVFWVMHDMWCATGICHHAGSCRGYMERCGNCPLLGTGAGARDLSRRVHEAKGRIAAHKDIHFVAVSHWLEERCRESSLLHDARISVVPNAFKLPDNVPASKPQGDTVEAVMAAARLDDEVKGLPILLNATKLLPSEVASRLRIVYCGDLRDRDMASRTAVRWEWKGPVAGREMPGVYGRARLVLSPSLYETLPGTLVEGQAYGCLPVAFDRGGQRDIITDGETGILASFGKDEDEAAVNFAAAICRAVALIDSEPYESLAATLRRSVESRFAASRVACGFMEIIEKELRARRGN